MGRGGREGRPARVRSQRAPRRSGRRRRRCEHIEQVTAARAARRGIGRALIDHLADRTLAQGGTALTLTTFADVPWNAPYYARIGFRPLTEAELTPALREIRAHEAELGLDRWPRLCMRRALTPRTAP